MFHRSHVNFYTCFTGNLDITDSKQFTQRQKLMENVPLLGKAIASNTDGGKVDGHLRILIAAILDNIVNVTARCPVPSDNQFTQIPDEPNPLEYFPCFPMKRGFGNFEADKKQKSVRCDNQTVTESRLRNCRKKSRRHHTLTPGLFTLFCQHEICIGFSMMVEVESPRTPFNILSQRFSQFLHKMVIVYDNCCNLYEFAQNRLPHMFNKTRFLIDRMHFKDHTNCTIAFNLDTYGAKESFVNLNSQCNEQANSELRRLSKQVTFQQSSQVMHHTSLFLAQRNRNKKLKQV